LEDYDDGLSPKEIPISFLVRVARKTLLETQATFSFYGFDPLLRQYRPILVTGRSSRFFFPPPCDSDLRPFNSE